ncbi:hypothetical protein LAZ40_05685 [Cereibacter sphaeroides]|uniref:hypothetical protein n=1 Tax=Cereibacter sphaeroides TaxID=1063 RepID=UPI001F3925DB|nr:hypothetical protein [Cereibacter sphaeroides]MCE6958541.1 hypothetical protein [Cereibacter sphaeroides]MCE6972796.1 hypothetical protein [Cereibacter sphaeroides]
MLFKKIVANYGRSLSGAFIRPEDDIIHAVTSPEARNAFRQQAVDDISAAKIYLLDPRAAVYADSFREEMQGGLSEKVAGTVEAFVREVELPAGLVWMEYDHAALMSARLKRGHVLPGDYRVDEFGERGFLFDNRHPDVLKITVFRTDGRGKLIDPFSHVTLTKDPDGKVVGDQCKVELHEHMSEFMVKSGAQPGDMREWIDQETADATYDMVLAYALFALIASRENGLVYEERESLTPKEAKTARKFGKAWITDALRSHVTIRIGPEAEAHLSERAARRQHERDIQEGRLPPVRHWVTEHERHYRNGKVVLIPGHYRGIEPGIEVPTRVKGPRPAAADGRDDDLSPGI